MTNQLYDQVVVMQSDYSFLTDAVGIPTAATDFACSAFPWLRPF